MTDAVFVGDVCTAPTGLLAKTQAEHLARRKRLGMIEQIQDFSRTVARLRAEVENLEKVKQLALSELDEAREELAKIEKSLVSARESHDFNIQPIRVIIKLTADYYNVRTDDLLGKSRTQHLSLPRHVVMYLAKIKTGQSLAEIGRRLGDRDHATVLHGIQKIENRLLIDPKLRDDMATLLARIAFVENKEKTNVE